MIVNAFSASVPQTTKTATEFWLGVFTSFGLKPVTPKELEQALRFLHPAQKKRRRNVQKSMRILGLAARAAVSKEVAKTLDRPNRNATSSVRDRTQFLTAV